MKYAKQKEVKVDHSKFEELDKDFSNPQEVTSSCLKCHNKRGEELLACSHYRWERASLSPNGEVLYKGKKNIINNYCIGVSSNEESCMRCHAGYAWNNSDYTFDDERFVDCLICHDNTGRYSKASGGAGYPSKNIVLSDIAKNVGNTENRNCGYCHFYGGGGNNVKHGDLEEALLDCDKEVDVHLSKNGANLSCTDCHTTEKHLISGQLYTISSMNRERVSCAQCHGEYPHKKNKLNEHTVKLSCQSCHIPEYAKVNATKVFWDWSTAGKLDENGEAFEINDEDGNHIYLSIKGDAKWEKNCIPSYIWSNGTANPMIFGDIVEDTSNILLNPINGAYSDDDAKIYPAKIMLGKQVYDPINKLILQPKLYAAEKGQGGYWKDFQWDTALSIGMQSLGLEYSGEYTFVRTSQIQPINHMVSPKENALSCQDCHQRNKGRLEGLTDFYMPGRDKNASIDTIGKIMLLLVLLAVLSHASARIFTHFKNNKREEK